MKTRNQEPAPGLLDTLRSIQFGIVVLIAIVVVAIAGTVIPQGEQPGFYAETYNGLVNALIGIFHLDNTYGSPLFLGLLGLFGLNLVLCTVHRFPGVIRSAFSPNLSPSRDEILSEPFHVSIPNASPDAVAQGFRGAGFRMRQTGDGRFFGEKGRLGHLGSTVVHLSLVLLLAGGMTSLLTGKRGHIVLHEGESTSLAVLPGGAKIPLGFTMRLDRFAVEYYEQHPDRPKSFTSAVTVTPFGDTPFTKEIRVNHPLIRNGLTVYQSSFGADENVASGNDTARVEIRLKGAPEHMPPVATLDMTAGGVYPVPGFGDTLWIRAAEIQRDFRMGDSSGDGGNPAVKIDVLVREEVRWSVYAFQKYPGLNMPMYGDLDLQFAMLGLLPGDSGNAAGAGPRYYTVLGVVRDRGVPIVWTGAFLMVIGLALSFYIRPRRIWMLAENGTVHIGARTKGDAASFRDSIERIIEKIIAGTR